MKKLNAIMLTAAVLSAAFIMRCLHKPCGNVPFGVLRNIQMESRADATDDFQQ